MNAAAEQLGAVVIGRNEGERLKRCLLSLHGQAAHIVYVDSGSTDGSVAFARSLGVTVVDLDLSRPFTMARGRNAGFRKLGEMAPAARYVQFVDGDCEVDHDWLATALPALAADEGLAAVAGRRRERHPEASLYNWLCDMEWDTPVGAVAAVGGDAMFRVAAFAAVNGFDERMIAGEEGELCYRLRQGGWRFLRLGAEMTRHDAAMARFSQWWKRTLRAGHAYAEGAHLHGAGPERYNRKPVRSSVIWGAAMPALLLALLGLSLWHWGFAAAAGALVLLHLLWLARMALTRRRRGKGWGECALYAWFCLLAKYPQALGIWKYQLNRWRGKRSELIEYKAAQAPA